MERLRTTVRTRRTSEELDRLILEIIAKANQPISAYDISERTSHLGAAVAPNQIYRTVVRLVSAGRVIRISSLHAYAVRPSDANACLVCINCHTVVTVNAPQAETELRKQAALTGFQFQDSLIEALGLCGGCGARAS